MATQPDYFDLGPHQRNVTTASESAQTWFDRGLNWTYGFNHEEAIICFENALEHDPDCAMAHWGIAYAVGPNYNKPWEAFEPEEARRLVRRIEFCYTPKHGSWLNIAECELSVMTRQSMSDRLPSEAKVRDRATAWSKERNEIQTGVDWQFTTDKARTKLKRLYPKIET